MAFQIVPFLIQIAVSIALTAIAAVIIAKPKSEKPEVQDFQKPDVRAGAPIPVVFGTKTVKGLTILWYGEKSTKSRNP